MEGNGIAEGEGNLVTPAPNPCNWHRLLMAHLICVFAANGLMKEHSCLLCKYDSSHNAKAATRRGVTVFTIPYLAYNVGGVLLPIGTHVP